MTAAPARPPRRGKAALYLRALAAYRRGVGALDALWTGLWLGAMSHAELHAVDEAFYESLGMYRTDAHNRRGLFDWEERALAAHFPAGGGTVLVVGAGGGREMLALAARGFGVEGFECNEALVAYARELLPREGCAGVVRPLARDRAPSGGGPYDAAMAGWSVYMLIPGRRRRIEFLRGVRPLLRPGAPLLISFFTRPEGGSRLRVVRAVGSAVRRLRLDEPVELGDDLTPNYVHRFSREEIEQEMTAAGFRLAGYEPQGPGTFGSGWAVGHAVGG